MLSDFLLSSPSVGCHPDNFPPKKTSYTTSMNSSYGFLGQNFITFLSTTGKSTDTFSFLSPSYDTRYITPSETMNPHKKGERFQFSWFNFALILKCVVYSTIMYNCLGLVHDWEKWQQPWFGSLWGHLGEQLIDIEPPTGILIFCKLFDKLYGSHASEGELLLLSY